MHTKNLPKKLTLYEHNSFMKLIIKTTLQLFENNTNKILF